MACAKGDADCVQLLLASRAAVNAAETTRRNTPLAMACSLGNSACAKLLISAGADIEARNEDGLTPLAIACLGDRADCVQLLIAGGAALNERGFASNGSTWPAPLATAPACSF